MQAVRCDNDLRISRPSKHVLTDAHLHLQNLDGDVDAHLAAGRAVGVARFVCNATSPSDFGRVAELARLHADVYPCFGVHPWFVNDLPDTWLDDLSARLDAQPSAVGEIGLDRWVEPRDEALQERVFRVQLRLAAERRRPAMIHCLRAWDWLLEVLASESPLPALLIHACGAMSDTAGKLLDLGATLSYAGNVFEAKRQPQRDVLRRVPINQLAVETDSPDMLPPVDVFPDVAGYTQNTPAHLPAIAHAIAELRDEDVERLADATSKNVARLLGLD